MNYKKILTILLIIGLAFVIVGSVQASSDGEKATIRGIDFNIPDGYEESDLSDRDNVSDIATTDTIIYSGDDGVFSIMVMEFEDSIGIEELLEGENTTINDINGTIEELDDGSYYFNYINDTSFITIHVDEKDLFEDILI
jgi:hypothetical protein